MTPFRCFLFLCKTKTNLKKRRKMLYYTERYKSLPMFIWSLFPLLLLARILAFTITTQNLYDGYKQYAFDLCTRYL